jgi:hypothetical protein
MPGNNSLETAFMTTCKRLKTLGFAILSAFALWTAPAQSAGTLPLAMAQQIDINGQPLAGCIVSFFVAGTVASPQNSFSDFGLSQNPNPILTCDQSGRIPMFWLADGLVHVRLTDFSGLQIIDTTMQVLGPSSGGGGGGGTVDPTAILATGDLKPKYGTGPLSGFVRLNGLTIGTATSGASERANADTQALFIYLYSVDPNLVVSGGRTGNALNDYNANKTITLPDWRGRALAALDDMGNSAAGRLTATFFGTSATVLGAGGGNQTNTLSVTNLPPITPAGTIVSVVNGGAGALFLVQAPTGGPINIGGAGSGGTEVVPTVASTFTGTPIGGASGPLAILPPMMLATIYIKL